jgi:hypothetical protein
VTRLAAVAFSSLAVMLAACSAHSAQRADVNKPSPAGARSSSSTPSFSPTTPPVAHVGGTLNLTGERGSAMAITLARIINPATGAEGPPTGDNGKPSGRYVAAMVTIKNTGKSALEDDANNDASLVGSNNEVYTPALSAVTECTNFDNGIYRLAPGESVTGCVAFALPSNVNPSRFKYTPSSGFAADFGEWSLS